VSEVKVTQADVARALKHLGFDSVEDLHYWAMDDSELSRFDALCRQFAEHRIAATTEALAAMEQAREKAQWIANFCDEKRMGTDDWFDLVEISAFAGEALATLTEQIERMRNGQG
jgi:NADH:ubiquinone oxidoreductase subunit D